MQLSDLSTVRTQFAYYKSLGDKTLAQVPDTALGWRYQPGSNSLTTLVLHLAGNMLSRWTDFRTTDGEKPWRDRDAEFEDQDLDRAALVALWEKGWACLFSALDSLTENELDSIIYIRNQGHTVGEAIWRQLAHYPYHVGQMVFLGKMVCDADWQSLSIPRGNSEAFNAEKFAAEKQRKHFLDAQDGTLK
jgi:hypothetical protein